MAQQGGEGGAGEWYQSVVWKASVGELDWEVPFLNWHPTNVRHKGLTTDLPTAGWKQICSKRLLYWGWSPRLWGSWTVQWDVKNHTDSSGWWDLPTLGPAFSEYLRLHQSSWPCPIKTSKYHRRTKDKTKRPEMLPPALLRVRITPRSRDKLSPFELYTGDLIRYCLTNHSLWISGSRTLVKLCYLSRESFDLYQQILSLQKSDLSGPSCSWHQGGGWV